jgi:hypothetical protein|tara:strand:- start:2371 stop:3108 length:738 start_codon:yes stop_codon:yes gene_type:complete
MANTHFSGPVLFSAARPTLENLNIGAWPDQTRFMDDFTGILLDATNDWTVVKDSGASAALQADALNGVVDLTSAATTDNDGSSIQGNEIWGLPSTAGQRLYFEARFQMSDVDQMDMFIGVCENFATNPEAIFTASNRIGFQIDDGDATPHLITESSDSETDTTLSGTTYDLSDATDVTVSFVATKGTTTDKVRFYINRTLVGTHTTNVPTANMTQAAAEVSGNATGTKSMSVDYIMVAQDRGVSY